MTGQRVTGQREVGRDGQAVRIALSLVSHTNAGKTTLARTLLGRDVGVVRDEPHVTEVAEAFPLIRTAGGDSLLLWDTPGFGDSVRLARRLAQSENPFGWLLAQVWDRLRDRPLWSSQQAIRNVREHADLVLYLVNAAEDPEQAGYVAPELEILDWIGKPVVVLVNQTGVPRPPDEEAAEVERWRRRVTAARSVRRVLALDAFTRCWVQEAVLMRAIVAEVEPALRDGAARLAQAWQARHEAVFDASLQVLARRVARAACDTEALAAGGLRATLREVGAALGVGRDGAASERRVAMRRLAERLDEDIRAGTDRLIALHGLQGRAAGEVLARLAEHYTVTAHLSEGKAAILGGLLTGSLAGLKADLATGGLTLGGGLIAGGIIGALGAAGLAKGYNLVRGADAVRMRFADPVLAQLVESGLLAYLAVAHYGRGRGEWRDAGRPAHWVEAVSASLATRAEAIAASWAARDSGAEAIAGALAGVLRDAALDALSRLYPGSPGLPGRPDTPAPVPG